MVEITLVRHGQAQTGARDEASYDRLSSLGECQASWLGAHWSETRQPFDRILCGTLLRQRQTAERIGAALGLAFDADPRLNEMDYFGLAESLKESHALPWPTDRESFLSHIAEVLRLWEAGEIRSGLESFDAFRERVRGVVADNEASGGRAMLVTSGGVIAMAMRQVMRLDRAAHGHVILQICNTSVHRYVKAGDALVLDTFNALPHLERADRLDARTFI